MKDENVILDGGDVLFIGIVFIFLYLKIFLIFRLYLFV